MAQETSNPPSIINLISIQQLIDVLACNLSLSELHDLGLAMNVDLYQINKEELKYPHEELYLEMIPEEQIAWILVNNLDKQNELSEFLDICKNHYPEINWNEVYAEAYSSIDRKSPPYKSPRRKLRSNNSYRNKPTPRWRQSKRTNQNKELIRFFNTLQDPIINGFNQLKNFILQIFQIIGLFIVLGLLFFWFLNDFKVPLELIDSPTPTPWTTYILPQGGGEPGIGGPEYQSYSILALNLADLQKEEGEIEGPIDFNLFDQSQNLGIYKIKIPKVITEGVVSIINLQITANSDLDNFKKGDYYELNENVKLSSNVIATLRGPSYEIETQTAYNQPFVKDYAASWNWFIEPLDDGIQNLILEISIPAYFDNVRFTGREPF